MFMHGDLRIFVFFVKFGECEVVAASTGCGLAQHPVRARVSRAGPARNGPLGPCLGRCHSPCAGTTRHGQDKGRAGPARK
jgi:hypothetical protein